MSNNSTGCFVYLIRHGDRKGRLNAIKIGYARDVFKRLKHLQIGNPVKLCILAAIPVDSENQAKFVESWLHDRFKKQHIRGEWFSGNIKVKSALSGAELAMKDIDWNEVNASRGGRYYGKGTK